MLYIFLNELFTTVTEWVALENEKPLFQLLIFYFSKMKSSSISSNFRETYLFSTIIANRCQTVPITSVTLVAKQSYLLVTVLWLTTHVWECSMTVSLITLDLSEIEVLSSRRCERFLFPISQVCYWYYRSDLRIFHTYFIPVILLQ